MTTLQIQSKVTIELKQILDSIAQVDTAELEQFLSQVSVMLAQRRAPSLSAQESALLYKINLGLPAQTQQRYMELSGKLQSNTITLTEQEELLLLIDEIERADGERLQALIELAQVRNVALPELMKQLGIHHPQPVYTHA